MSRITTAAVAAFLALYPVSAIAGEPYGTWLRTSTGTQIEFYDCGGKLCAKVAKVADPAKQSAVGSMVMDGADPTGDNKWKGTLMSEGKSYSGYVTLIDDGHLKLEGCALGGLLCKSDTLTRVAGN